MLEMTQEEFDQLSPEEQQAVIAEMQGAGDMEGQGGEAEMLMQIIKRLADKVSEKTVKWLNAEMKLKELGVDNGVDMTESMIGCTSEVEELMSVAMSILGGGDMMGEMPEEGMEG